MYGRLVKLNSLFYKIIKNNDIIHLKIETFIKEGAQVVHVGNFIKGIIIFDVDPNSVRSKSVITPTKNFQNKFMQAKEQSRENITHFNSYLESFEGLRESWREIVGEIDILFVNLGSDMNILYVDEATQQLRFAIIWSSNNTFTKVLTEAYDIFKKLLYEISKQDKHNFVIKYKITSNAIFSKTPNFEFFAFFKNSYIRDDNVDIENLQVEFSHNKILNKMNVKTYAIIIAFYVLLFFCTNIDVGTLLLTSTVALLSNIIINLIENLKKPSFKVELKTLNYNESSATLQKAIDDPDPVLNGTDLTGSIEEE